MAPMARPTAKPDAVVMFLVAEQYWKASHQLAQPASREDVAFPTVVCAAFALEIYLKCLLVMQTGKFSPSHNLKHIFGELPSATQARIRDLFAPYLPMVQKTVTKMTKPGSPLPPTVDFDFVMNLSQDAFTVTRYVYEGVPSMSGWMGTPIVRATRTAILELHPDWETRRLQLGQPLEVMSV
jgi:hypothetical protein